MKIARLFIYPVKSLGGIEIQTSSVDLRGLVYDRRWVIVDERNRFMSQRENTHLALFKCKIAGAYLEIHNKDSKIQLELFPTPSKFESIQVWDDTIQCGHVSAAADTWLSQALGQPVRLFYQDAQSDRLIDPNYAANKEQTSLSDGYPILILGQASLDQLNNKLETAIDFDRFRPNIVIDTDVPHIEDTWAEIAINNMQAKGVKPCARCVMTTINQTTGDKSAEPLKTLNTYRKQGNKVLFGENFLVISGGQVSVGDHIIVKSKK
jgi:uncharacterized protein